MARLLRLKRGTRTSRGGSVENQPGHAAADAPRFAVERFEHIEVDGSSTLIRVVGDLSPADLRAGELELVTTAGARTERRPLLAPPAPIGGTEGWSEERVSRWQLAFSIPSEVVAAE